MGDDKFLLPDLTNAAQIYIFLLSNLTVKRLSTPLTHNYYYCHEVNKKVRIKTHT